jgi:hypothetical protein
MAIQYIHQPTGDIVQREIWRWVAIYADGSALRQFELADGRAIFHKFAEIETDKLFIFRLEHDTEQPIDVLIPHAAKPIHYYKHTIARHEQRHESGQSITWEDRIKWYVIGYELDGRKSLIVVTDKNEKILTDDPDRLQIKNKGNYAADTGVPPLPAY